jgi:hypothetical protein
MPYDLACTYIDVCARRPTYPIELQTQPVPSLSRIDGGVDKQPTEQPSPKTMAYTCGLQAQIGEDQDHDDKRGRIDRK